MVIGFLLIVIVVGAVIGVGVNSCKCCCTEEYRAKGSIRRKEGIHTALIRPWVRADSDSGSKLVRVMSIGRPHGNLSLDQNDRRRRGTSARLELVVDGGMAGGVKESHNRLINESVHCRQVQGIRIAYWLSHGLQGRVGSPKAAFQQYSSQSSDVNQVLASCL